MILTLRDDADRNLKRLLKRLPRLRIIRGTRSFQWLMKRPGIPALRAGA